jgi:hypothetical protein
MRTEIKNAVINRTQLGVHHTDHGILSFYIHLDYGGSGQGFGGWQLDGVNPVYKAGDHRAAPRVPTSMAASLLLSIDEVFGCDWEDLKGVSCRAYRHLSVKAIGHYLKDKWFWIQEDGLAFVVGPLEQLNRVHAHDGMVKSYSRVSGDTS